jgi:hypothetical protein
MSSGGFPPPESIDTSGLPVLVSWGSTSVPTSCRPFKVSLMASNEHSMRASLGNGGGGIGGVGGACDDAPLPRLPRVLTILYALTYINQVVRVSSRMFQIGATQTRNRVRHHFSLLVCK